MNLKKRQVYWITLFFFSVQIMAVAHLRGPRENLPPWDPDSYWTYDASWAQVSNTPFRLYKQNQHEGGISSPLIAHWPKGIKKLPGSISINQLI